MQLHDILLLRTSAILPEAISAGGLTPTTDTSLFLTTYRGGSHLPADIIMYTLFTEKLQVFSEKKHPQDNSYPGDVFLFSAFLFVFPLLFLSIPYAPQKHCSYKHKKQADHRCQYIIGGQGLSCFLFSDGRSGVYSVRTPRTRSLWVFTP